MAILTDCYLLRVPTQHLRISAVVISWLWSKTLCSLIAQLFESLCQPLHIYTTEELLTVVTVYMDSSPFTLSAQVYLWSRPAFITAKSSEHLRPHPHCLPSWALLIFFRLLTFSRSYVDFDMAVLLSPLMRGVLWRKPTSFPLHQRPDMPEGPKECHPFSKQELGPICVHWTEVLVRSWKTL